MTSQHIPITMDYNDNPSHLAGFLNPENKLLVNLFSELTVFDIAPQIIHDGQNPDGTYKNPRLVGVSILTSTARKRVSAFECGLTKAIERTYEYARDKEWDRTYWAFDVHGTILKPDYTTKGISHEFYPYAKETLQKLSEEKNIILILYTSSKEDKISRYMRFFNGHGIFFKYANENPEVTGQPGHYGSYDKKMYFNVLVEDKAGFDPDTDWFKLLKFIENEDNIAL